MDYVSARKAINRSWNNQKPHLTLKTKMINNLKKIQIDQNTMTTNGQSSGQLFLKRWPLSNPNRTLIIMNKHMVNHQHNSDTKTNTYYNYCLGEIKWSNEINPESLKEM